MQPPQRCEVFAISLFQSNQQIKLALALQDFGNDDAIHRRFDKLGDFFSSETIIFELVSVDFDLQLRNFGLLLDLCIGNTINSFDCGLDQARISPERIKIIAIKLDANLCFNTRYHVGDQVSQRLFDTGDDAGHIF